MNKNKIKSALANQHIGCEIHTFDEIVSTNDYAKELAKQDAPSGTVILAQTQTKGRGRMNRRWESPRGTGIYLSVLLRPEKMRTNPFFFSIVSAVAAVSAIKKISGVNACIKWPNDILIEEKKIAGILTESSFKNGVPVYLVIGMGININTLQESFSKEVKKSATSLKVVTGVSHSNLEITILLLKEFEEWYNRYCDGKIEYIKRQWLLNSPMIGHTVSINTGSTVITGCAQTINEKGFLIVTTPEGEQKEIFCGEAI